MRTTWTNELLMDRLRPICEQLGYFPSTQDLRGLGRNDIAVQVSRRGGFVHWSGIMGYERRPSDTDTGWLGEKQFASLLTQSGYEVTTAGTKSPFDLLVNRVLRIDVKSARAVAYGNNSPCWYYRVGKYPQADIVVFYQLDTNSFYALPWWECPVTNITFNSNGGKYRWRLNDWNVIDSMLAARVLERQTG